MFYLKKINSFEYRTFERCLQEKCRNHESETP